MGEEMGEESGHQRRPRGERGKRVGKEEKQEKDSYQIRRRN